MRKNIILLAFCFLFLGLVTNVKGQVPTITAFSPTSGTVGTTVTITGANFNTTPANNIVYFGAVKATVTASTATSITCTVPVGATSVTPITVQDNMSGFQTSSITSTTSQFTVTNNPILTIGTNSYTTSSFGVGTQLSSVATADFNGDGKVDLAVANENSNNISVLLGTGTGSFSTATNFAVGTNPLSVAVGDFNGDGKTDLVTANTTSDDASILLGTGTGSFGTATNFTAGITPVSVVVGDFNNDGKSDLAVAGGGGTVSILLSIGNGDFDTTPPSIFFSSDYPVSLAVGDFNGDGKIDLAVANYNSSIDKVSILLGTGTGSFGSATNYNVGTGILSIVVGDFNADGKADLATAISNNIKVLQGTGTGTFVTLFSLPGINPKSLAIGDFDGDNKIDLISADGGNIQIFKGNGSGGFAPSVVVGVGGGSIINIGDFNGDGKTDWVTNYGTSEIRVGIYNPTPTITSFSPTSGTVGTTVTITGTDFNTTPANNIVYFGAVKATVTASTTTSITCTVPVGATSVTPITVQDKTTGLQTSSITSTTPQFTVTNTPNLAINTNSYNKFDFSTGVGSAPEAVATGDFNGDGKVDLAVANFGLNNISIFLGAGAGSFGTATNFNVGTSPLSVAVGDFNGDGKPDLAVANFNSDNVSVLIGTGTGTFGTATNYTVGTSPRSVGVGDFNGDGKLDLAVANANSNNVSILLGTGTGSFGAATNFTAGSNPYSLVIGDFNRDGKPDLAVSNVTSNNVSILLNTGTGTSFNSTNFSVGSSPYSITVGDFNGDGKADLATANYTSNNISVLLGVGTNSFGVATNFAVGTNPICVVAGDFNGDGKIDLAVANRGLNNSGVLVGTGTGTGSFSVATNFGVGTNPFFVRAGDLNDDGKADLITVNKGSNNISILFYTEPPNALPPTNQGANNFTANWSSVLGATSYRLDISTDINFGSFIAGYNNLTVNSTSQEVVGLSLGTTYYYRVRAFNGTITSGNSNVITVNFSIPPIPTATAATNLTNKTFTANWNAVAGITQYQLDVSIDNSFTNLIVSNKTVTGTSALVENLTAGLTYYYRVRAYNGTFASPNSNVIAVPISRTAPSSLVVSPLVGKIDDIITITGVDFSLTKDENIVKFGEKIAIVEEAKETELKVRVPANISGRVNITVSIIGRASAPVVFDIVPEIASISPFTANFNETISIIGTGFSPITANNVVTFGTTVVKVVSASATSLLVQVPENLPTSKLSVSVKVGEQTGTLADAFSITPPAVQNFSPSEAYAGENITILGSGFPKSGAKITIGGVEATIVGVVGSGSIIVKIPQTLLGKSEIVVQFGTLEPIKIANTLLVKNVLLSKVEPIQGFTGDEITISGDGFNTTPAGNRVFFGQFAAEVISASRSELKVKVPAEAKGDITLSVQAGIKVDFPEKFSANIISFTAISPPSAKVDAVIELSGRGFETENGKTTVSIGGMNADIIKTTSNKITVKVPNIPFGKSKIEVSSRGDKREKDFLVEPNIIDIAPANVYVGERITIRGTGFSAKAEDYQVSIGGVEVAVQNPSNTQFSFSVPKGIGGKVSIALNGNNLNNGSIIVETKIDRIEPANAKIGDIITIWGTGFSPIREENTIIFAGEAEVKPILEKGVSEDWVKVQVPQGSKMSGEIFVDAKVLNARKVTAKEDFGITPTISGFSPEGTTTPNALITINGTGFSETNRENQVFFGLVKADVINSTTRAVTVRVPNLSGVLGVRAVVSKQESQAKDIDIKAGISIIAPKTNDFLQYGSPLTVTFASNLQDPMKIELLRGGEPLPLSQGGFIGFTKAGETSYQAFVASSIPKDSNYQIRVSSEKNKNISELSGVFNIGFENLESKLSLINLVPAIPKNSPSPLTVSVSVGTSLRGNGIDIIFFYKPLSSRLGYKSVAATLRDDGSRYTAEIKLNEFDDLGVQYYFQARKNGIEQAVSNLGITLLGYENLEIMPYTKFGKGVENYEMVSIPLDLNKKTINDIFREELGNYDIKRWRTYAYRNGSTNEFAGGTVNAGEAFWLIIKDKPEKFPMLTGAGTTVKTSTEAEKMYAIDVQEGWNQVGNPYTFPISIKRLKELNENKSLEIADVNAFDRGYLPSVKIDPFRGVFLYAGKSGKLRFPPIPFDANSDGRVEENEFTSSLSSDSWQVKLNLLSSTTKPEGFSKPFGFEKTNDFGGFGMHPKASKSKDEFDRLTPPRFLEHLEINFMHPEYRYPYFSKDIVPTQENYVWEFSVESGTDGNYKTLSWEKIAANQDKALILFDIEKNIKIDMSKETDYTFELGSGKKNFKIYFGDEKFLRETILPENASAVAYPNPFTDNLKFSISVPEKSKAYLQIYNNLGQVMIEEEKTFANAGFYVWDLSGTLSSAGEQTTGTRSVPAGVYHYRARVVSEGTNGANVQIFSGKLIKQ